SGDGPGGEPHRDARKGQCEGEEDVDRGVGALAEGASGQGGEDCEYEAEGVGRHRRAITRGGPRGEGAFPKFTVGVIDSAEPAADECGEGEGGPGEDLGDEDRPERREPDDDPGEGRSAARCDCPAFCDLQLAGRELTAALDPMRPPP